jgi:hypothetical protein
MLRSRHYQDVLEKPPPVRTALCDPLVAVQRKQQFQRRSEYELTEVGASLV